MKKFRKKFERNIKILENERKMKGKMKGKIKNFILKK
jgi:hypothetical protein